jgi:hypothetical protein
VQGADGAKVAYSLGVSSPNVDSGLIDSATGQHIFLVLNGNTVEGHVGATATLAFTLALNPATGVVALADLRAVHQDSPDTPTDISEGISLNSIANLVTLKATSTDKDSDTAAATIDLGKQVTFNDDGPSIQVKVLGEEQRLPFLVVDESFLTAATNGVDGSTPDITQTTQTANFSAAFTSVQGADGAVVTYAPVIAGNGTLTNLIDSATGLGVVLDQTGNVVQGYVTGHEGEAAFLVFTLSVNATTGDVTLTQDRAVHEGVGETPDISEGIPLGSSLVRLAATITDKDGDTAVHGAAYLGNSEMVNYLVSKGAKVDVKSKAGDTVADMANGQAPAAALAPARNESATAVRPIRFVSASWMLHIVTRR